MKKSFNAYFAAYSPGLRDITARTKNAQGQRNERRDESLRAEGKPESNWKSVPKMNATTTLGASNLLHLAEIDTTTSPSVFREKTNGALRRGEEANPISLQSFDLTVSRPQALARHNGDLSSFLSFPSPSSVKRTHGISFTALLSKGIDDAGRFDAFLRTVSVNLAPNEEQAAAPPSVEGRVMAAEEEAEEAQIDEEIEPLKAAAIQKPNEVCFPIKVPLKKKAKAVSSPQQVKVQRRPMKEETYSHAPNILERSRKINRAERVDDLLYKDALRRQEQLTTNAKIREAQSTCYEQWGVSNTSENAASLRFAKDFARAWPSAESNVDLNGFLTLLANLGFANAGRMAERAWETLNGPTNGVVSRQSALVFLAAVCGLTIPKLDRVQETAAAMARDAADSPSEGKETLDSHQGRPVDAPQELIGLERVREIHRQFDALYRSRLSRGESRAESVENGLSLQPSRRRELSEQSRGLAKQKREKVLSQARELLQANGMDVPSEKVSVVDFLRIEAVLKAEEKKQLRARVEEERLRECTFRPVTTDVRRGLARTVKTEEDEPREGSLRTLELYNLSRARPEKRDRQADEIDIERARAEYTFAPKVSGRAPLSAQIPREHKGDVDKAVARLRDARKERERCEKIKERGCAPIEAGKGFVCGVEKKFKASFGSVSHSRDKALSLRKDVGKGKSTVTTSLYARSREQWRSICADRAPATMPTAGSDEESDSEGATLFVVDINLPNQQTHRVVVREGDSPPNIAANVGLRYGLDQPTIRRLRVMLDARLVEYNEAK